MSITTYAELKTALANWSHRTDLTTRLGEFISLAESRINRVIEFSQQEVETTLTATIGSRTIALPTGFIAPIELWLTTWQPRDPLTFVPVDQLPVSITPATPEYWTIDGENVAFDAPANLAYTFSFRYTKTDNLSDTNVDNWLLLSHPDVYLYAALIELAAYIRDVDALAVWKQAYDLAIAEVNDKEHRTKAKATLFTDLPTRPRSDIYKG
jgi:hypothetical protein